AHLLPVAVDRKRRAVEGIRHEEWDELLGVLVRPVRVRAAGDRRVDAVRADVGEHLQVAARLGGAVRARRTQRVALERASTRLEVAVHLVRRDLDEARAVLARPLEEGYRPEDVRVDELLRAE